MMLDFTTKRPMITYYTYELNQYLWRLNQLKATNETNQIISSEMEMLLLINQIIWISTF